MEKLSEELIKNGLFIPSIYKIKHGLGEGTVLNETIHVCSGEEDLVLKIIKIFEAQDKDSF